ncbi:MAG: Dethiobiotin synthetase [Leptolyngbya sp. SIO4C1]|nr:Dethiobiotin synthetase [Leptolyngbya sp. SIO4C1]
MDFETACELVMKQALIGDPPTDAFLARLQQLQPPVPGQVTSLLLALKVIADRLKAETRLDRQLAYALHQLAYRSRWCYEKGRRRQVDWPPLLDEDVERIAIAIERIFAGQG